MGFNLNQSIPSKIYLTHGKGDERPFVEKIAAKGQTAVADRYYQCHKNFDEWRKRRNPLCMQDTEEYKKGSYKAKRNPFRQHSLL